MRTTDRTTTLPANSQASQSQGRGSDQRGSITLEWLLIVGAVAGLAATSVLAVQRVVDDTSEVPVDPLVRVLEADIAAAFIAADATAWRAAITDPSDLFVIDEWAYRTRGLKYAGVGQVGVGFYERCVRDLVVTFGDVVSRAQFEPPTEYDWDVPEELAKANEDPLAIKAPARCTVELRAGLDG